MLFSTDKSFKKPKDVQMTKILGEKRLIFIRHGESEWNLIFNKGVLKLLPRLIIGWVKEMFFFVSKDSVFYDSPLNLEGIHQAKTLLDFVEEPPKKCSKPVAEVAAILRGELSTSVITASNLRRAIGTCAIGLLGRLQRTKEHIKILSSLQEISRNVDTISLAVNPDEKLTLPRITKALKVQDINQFLECSENFGNKPIRGTGLQRLNAFCVWSFNRPEENVIIGGHSLWFRYFFQMFLPSRSSHVSKKYKIHNSGVIALVLQKGLDRQGREVYQIKEESIMEVFRGFDLKKKKNK